MSAFGPCWFGPCLLGAALAAVASVAAATPPIPADAYRAEVASWRQERDKRLRAHDGWLAVVGLFWLKPGANRFGSARDNEILLPDAAPPYAGTFVLEGRAVRLIVPAGSPLTLNGGLPQARVLHTDAGPTPPDVLAIGSTSWQVIERAERLGVRVKDSSSPLRRTFPGSNWFPIVPAYRVIALLTPRKGPIEMVVPDASGGRQKMKSPGTLTFTLLGKPQHLDPVLDGDDDANQLIVFRDGTSGRETYGGGRFVRADRQPDGTFVIDFNRAYAPPCAFTPYATCPLPPEQNRMRIAVNAGQKNTDAMQEKPHR
jgi:uncharacterized protein (DUF1684 family)